MGVKIRQKRKKLYLDIYVNGNRTWEALGLTLTGDPAANKEVMRLAEFAKARREQQVFSGQWGLQDRVSAKMSLYAYLEKMGEGRNRQKDRVCKVLPWLKKYPGGESVQLGALTEKWFANFQRYLQKDSGLSPQSASSYAYAVRMALRQAVRENILPGDPSEGIRGDNYSRTRPGISGAGGNTAPLKNPHGRRLGGGSEEGFSLCLLLRFTHKRPQEPAMARHRAYHVRSPNSQKTGKNPDQGGSSPP
jgi:hypothetical protein